MWYQIRRQSSRLNQLSQAAPDEPQLSVVIFPHQNITVEYHITVCCSGNENLKREPSPSFVRQVSNPSQACRHVTLETQTPTAPPQVQAHRQQNLRRPFRLLAENFLGLLPGFARVDRLASLVQDRTARHEDLRHQEVIR